MQNPSPDIPAPAALPSGPDLWAELATRAGVSLSQQQLHDLSRYLDLLSAGNQTMNLTRITDRPAAEVQHVGDALTLLPYLPPGPIQVADVGSGGGVPGIPLAIARPEARFLLIESTRKKAAFLRQTIASLGLTNVQVNEQRAEDLARPDARIVLRETFDVAAARAVATMDWLAEWCLPLVKKGGRMLAMKGPRAAEEVPAAAKAIRQLGGGVPVWHPVVLPGAENHVIIEIAKIARTDWRYPRAATQAKGKPLG